MGHFSEILFGNCMHTKILFSLERIQRHTGICLQNLGDCCVITQHLQLAKTSRWKRVAYLTTTKKEKQSFVVFTLAQMYQQQQILLFYYACRAKELLSLRPPSRRTL